MKVKGFKSTIEWYNKNAAYYAKAKENRQRDDLINGFAKLLPKEKPIILDAGSGSGRDSKIFSDKNITVIGVDISKGLIGYSKSKYPNIEFVEGDFRNLQFKDNYFDGVWAHASLLHFDTVADVKKSLKEFYRVLKNGGIIRIAVKKITDDKFKIISENGLGEKRFFQYFSREEFEKFLKNQNFRILEFQEFAGRRDIWLSFLARK